MLHNFLIGLMLHVITLHIGRLNRQQVCLVYVGLNRRDELIINENLQSEREREREREREINICIITTNHVIGILTIDMYNAEDADPVRMPSVARNRSESNLCMEFSIRFVFTVFMFGERL